MANKILSLNTAKAFAFYVWRFICRCELAAWSLRVEHGANRESSCTRLTLFMV